MCEGECSEYVANTMRNCDSMMNIVKNLNVFSENYDKLDSFMNHLNESFDYYADDSMKAIKNDLIKITLKGIDWKDARESLSKNARESLSKSSSINHKRDFEPIILNKPSHKTLSNEFVKKMIETKDIENRQKASEFNHYRRCFKSLIKKFPTEVSEFENKVVIERNNHIKSARELAKKLLREHKEYCQATINGKSFTELSELEYPKSQKEFIVRNLNRLIRIE